MKKIKNIFLIFLFVLIIFIFYDNISEYILNKKNNLIGNIDHDINNEENNKKIKVEYYSCIDGDTAKFKLNDEIIKVRFLGIDTPETPNSPRGEGEFWEEATNFVKKKLENANKIEIEYDENALKKDKYDRDLAWVFVDDELLQEKIVLKGLAKTYVLHNNYKYYNELNNAEEYAKKNNLGIWKK